MVNMWINGGGTMALGYPPVSITLGKCVGGTSTVNSGTCFHTLDFILKKWQDELGLDSLYKESLDRYFKKVEEEINVTELSWKILGNISKIVKRGADKLGLNCRPLKHNVRNCRGCGTCQFGCYDGAKQSADVTYIPRRLKTEQGFMRTAGLTDL